MLERSSVLESICTQTEHTFKLTDLRRISKMPMIKNHYQKEEDVLQVFRIHGIPWDFDEKEIFL